MKKIASMLLVLIIVFPSAASQQSGEKHKNYPHKRTAIAKLKKSSKTSQTAIQYKEADWPNELRAGDCGEKPGTLTIGSDGSIHWDAVTYTYSTHSGDIWHASFRLLDKDDVTLDNTRQFDSPRMNDGNGGPSPRYPWTGDDNYDGTKFDAAVSVLYFRGC